MRRALHSFAVHFTHGSLDCGLPEPVGRELLLRGPDFLRGGLTPVALEREEGFGWIGQVRQQTDDGTSGAGESVIKCMVPRLRLRRPIHFY